MGRVEHWCQEDSAGLSVSAPFGWRCLTSPGTPRTPAPPHRTGRAVLPHPALRSPSAAGMRGHPARSAQRPSRHRGDPRSAREGFQPRGNPLGGSPPQRRGESAAPSLDGGSVVLHLPAVLRAAPTPDTARLDFGSALYEPVERPRSPCRASRGAPWSYARMPSLLPRKAPGDLAAVGVT